MKLYVVDSDVNSTSLLHEIYSSHEGEHIPDGSGSSHFDGPEGWIYGLDMVRLTPRLWESGLVGRAIDEVRRARQVGALRQVLVNRLKPYGKLDLHRDGLPDRLRFHLPLQTRKDAYWFDELNGRIHMELGAWYGPVPYCGVLHAAHNPTPVDRIHLVVDFDRR